jgi:hypothetical protein
MKLISPQIKQQYFDSNGDPLTGGKLYVYTAGTETPVTTYTTEAGGTENANPIILDSRGEVGGLFLDPGSYKFVLHTSLDVPIWTEDNITVRDFGAEIDAIELQIEDIDETIATEAIANRVVSGKSSANSSQSRFLVPIGSSNQVKILATATDLVYVVDSTSYALTADLVASGLVSPPVTNNTALINDATFSDQNFTTTLGEFGTSIPYDTAGAEITNRDGDLVAFKIAGASTEYFIARIDNANSRLIEASRGYFYDSSENPIERTGFSNNDVLTLMKLTWLYLKSTGVMLASYTEPVYSATEPSSPLDGDMWYDLINNKWKRFNSTAYEDSISVFIGLCVQDENSDTVGARAIEYHSALRESVNTFNFKYQDATSVKSVSRQNTINVNGNELKFLESYKEFNIVSDLEDGYTEAASTYYYPYINEEGDKIISPVAPLDRRGDLLGFYHPYEMWRYPGGRVFNNASSSFDAVSVTDSPEKDPGRNIGQVITTANVSVDQNTNAVFCDATSGNITVNLPPSNMCHKQLVIKKTDTSANTVTIDPHASETIDGATSLVLSLQKQSATILPDGSNWQQQKYMGLKFYIIVDSQTSGTAPQAISATTWTTLRYSTLEGFSGASLASNEITLPAGTYIIGGSVLCAPSPAVTSTTEIKLRLYNVTAAAAVCILGETSTRSNAGQGVHSQASIAYQRYFTLSAASALRLEIYGTRAFEIGSETNLNVGGEVEVYNSTIFTGVGF